jgi:response regulator NasT
MFSDANDSALIEAAVQAGVSAYVVDGMQPHRLRPIIEVAIARFREFQALRDELQQTRNKLAERREIEKAKGILMKQKGMAEEEAYQALRKLAMDQGLKIGEVARQLISIAKLLG